FRVGRICLNSQKTPLRVQGLHLLQHSVGRFGMGMPGKSNIISGGGKSVHSRRPDSTATAGYQNMMRIRGYIKHWRYLLAMKVYRHCGVRVLRPAASGAGKGKSFAEAPALLRPAGRSRSRDDG